MATEQNNTFINTFTGGMNTDSAYDTIKNNQYIYAVNLRPYGTSKIYNSNDIAAYGKYGVMTPVKALHEDVVCDTKIIPQFNTDETQRIIKVITAGDTNVLIKLHENYIYLYKVVASDKLPRYIWSFLCKIKVREKPDDLRNVSAVLQYETDDVVNLYIADGEHKIIIINVKDTTYINSLRDKNGEINVDLISQNMYFPKNAITYNAIVSGQLKTSQVQYTYRFYKKYGVTSKLAPLSRKYQVINPSRDTEVGCAENTTTSIGLQLEMKVNEKIDQFDRLQVYRIQYLKPNQNAEIDLIYDGEFAKNEKGATIHIIDNGRKTLQTLSVEEFSQIHGQDIIPTLLEQNQGYLFAGNVKDTTIFQLDREDLKKFWAIQFMPISNNGYNIPYLVTDTYSEPRDYVYKVKSGNEAVLRFTSNSMFNNADYSNPYADVNHAFDKNHSEASNMNYSNTMFDYNNYIGGSGVYISWKLLVANVVTDEETTITYSSDYIHYDNQSGKFEYYGKDESKVDAPKEADIISDCGFPKPDKVSHNNAITSSCIKSLKRGEVYRYGIILYKNDGTRSDVVWIGDIRIPGPDIVELNKNYTTKQIGIEFTLTKAFKDFAFTNNICGYEIVRCQRTDEYSRSLQQVVIASTVRQQLVDGTYSPYYPTGFIISNPQYVGYTPLDYDGGQVTTQWPMQMTSGASDNMLYQIYCPEIQTYVDDVLNKLKTNQISLTPALYLYSYTTDEIVKFTKDDAYSDSTRQQINISNWAQRNKIFSLSFVPLIGWDEDYEITTIKKELYTFGKYTNVNYKTLSYSKSDKSNKINKLEYRYSTDTVYSRRFFMTESGSTVTRILENLQPRVFNDRVDIDNVSYTKETTFKLNQNNYSKQILAISNVRMLNWEDGFSNHVMDGSMLSNAVKKYKSYAKNISTSSYLNWVCSSKYDIPVGTSNEYGWTDKPWTNVVEFTNVDNANKHKKRTYPAIGPIGPAARCLVVQLDGDKESLDDLIPDKSSPEISRELKNVFGEVVTTNLIKNGHHTGLEGVLILPHSEPTEHGDDNKLFYKDPEEVSELNSYPGTLLCEITHPAIHYSGKDMSSKQYDTYYGFGDYKACSLGENDVNKISVFTGDMYTQIYEIEGMYKAYDFNDDKSSLQSMQTIHYIPMESTINQYFDYGMNYRNTNNANLQAEAGEIKGVSSQDRPVHQYNLIYSDNGTSNDLYSPQSTTHLQNTYTQRICYSQLKTNGELLNNWNIFKPIDYIDVNPIYGELTDLFTTQDTLYFWQTKAFGKLSVNERSLVKDENSNLIQLGQGTVLQRSDYLSTKFGMRAQDMCKVNVDNDIYWFDYGNKCIASYKATSGAYGSTKMSVLDFTENCNVKTLMQMNITDNVQVPTITYDATNDELLFHPIKNNSIMSEEMTLAFNCRLNIAQSMYSMLNGQLATVYNNLTNQNDAISINSKLTLYTRWCDDGETPTPDEDTARLHFVVNPNPSTTKVFDNQQIVFPQLYNTASSHAKQTADYDNFDCNLYTDLDRAGIVDKYTNREGNICFPIPRCADGIRRLRGKWMIEEMLMDSNDNDHAISHIITKFRQSYN